MMRNKVAWWPQAMNPRKAGVRIRCLNPLEVLRSRGVPVELYDPAHSSHYRSVIVQAWAAFATGQADDPDSFLAEVRRLKAAGIRIVVDNCDNQFYNPRRDAAWDQQVKSLRQLLDLADQMVCSTSELAAITRAEGYPDLPIEVIGDAIESKHDLLAGDAWYKRFLNPKRLAPHWQLLQLRFWVNNQRRAGRLPLVWFGNHGVTYSEGGMGDILKWRAGLETLHRERPLALTVISNHPQKFHDFFHDWTLPTHYLTWSRLTFLAALELHDTALLPVSQNPFTVCKSNNRLVTALWHGLQVIADPLPSYLEFAPFCHVNGLDADALEYLSDEAGRKPEQAALQHYLRQHWHIQPIADAWGGLIHRELGHTRPDD